MCPVKRSSASRSNAGDRGDDDEHDPRRPRPQAPGNAARVAAARPRRRRRPRRAPPSPMARWSTPLWAIIDRPDSPWTSRPRVALNPLQKRWTEARSPVVSSVGVPDEQGDLGGDDRDAAQQHPRAEHHAEGAGTEPGGEGQRAEAGRRVDADDTDGVRGVGVGASSGRGGSVVPAPVPRPAGDEAADGRSPSAAARRPPGHRRRPSRCAPITVKYTVTPAHSTISSLIGALLLDGGASPPAQGGGRPGRGDVGVLAPAQVEHRPLRADRRQPREVVLGRRRRRRPLQRVGLPRIGAGRRGRAQRAHDVDGERDERHEQDHRADRGDHVPALEVVDRLVVGDAARHAVAAEQVHDEERQC